MTARGPEDPYCVGREGVRAFTLGEGQLSQLRTHAAGPAGTEGSDPLTVEGHTEWIVHSAHADVRTREGRAYLIAHIQNAEVQGTPTLRRFMAFHDAQPMTNSLSNTATIVEE